MSVKENNLNFVKSYDVIKGQLEGVRAECKKIMASEDFSDSTQSRLDRLDTIEVVLNWVLKDDDEELRI